MRTYHEKVVDQALEYIRRVHSDQSVSLEQTLESLELLEDAVVDRIVAVREDIQRRDNANEVVE